MVYIKKAPEFSEAFKLILLKLMRFSSGVKR
jgi:hypothetical protein